MAASVNTTFTESYRQPGGKSISNTVVVISDNQIEVHPAIPVSTSNQLVAFAVTAAKVQWLYIITDADVTIKTNSSGSPAQTFTLKAGKPWVWYVGGTVADPITTDITALYVTNASATVPANLDIYVGYNL